MKPRLARHARLHFDRHAKSWMLLFPERGLVLNESARAIIERCDGTRTVEMIVDDLAVATGGPRDAIARDVADTIEFLRTRRLLAREEP